MKKYTNADLAQDYLKVNDSKEAYAISLNIDSLKTDIPEYYSKNKSLFKFGAEGIDDRTKGILEEILAKREERALKSRSRKMRKKQDTPRKLNYNYIQVGRGNIR